MADRVRAISDAGFAVEIWDWRNHDLDVARGPGRERRRFTSMTGYTTGTLADEAGADELLRTAAESVVVSRRLGTPSLNLHGTGPRRPRAAGRAGRRGDPAMWDTARRTLGRIAELGEREGVTFVLENLNTAVDHPGTPFARAADTLDLVRGVDSPHLKLNLDLYHAQIGEGNLIELCREALPWVAEVQVADVPGGASRAPARSAMPASPVPSRMPGSPASWASRRSPAATGCRADRLPRGLHPLTGDRSVARSVDRLRHGWRASQRRRELPGGIASPRARRTRSAWVAG